MKEVLFVIISTVTSTGVLRNVKAGRINETFL